MGDAGDAVWERRVSPGTYAVDPQTVCSSQPWQRPGTFPSLAEIPIGTAVVSDTVGRLAKALNRGTEE
jgi:hypothetical protein